MNHYFVTGIGTGVGKTLSAAVLTEALRADYWKPVQTGSLEDNDTLYVREIISNPKTICFKEAYLFKEPASPHLAAALENRAIELSGINLPVTTNPNLIIEGAGGLLVPLNDKDFVIDIAKKFDAEVVLVCRNYLGCINHSLLSIDFLIKNNFRIKGLVLNGTFDPLVKKAIVSHAQLPVLAEFPDLAHVNKAIVLQLAGTIGLQNFK